MRQDRRIFTSQKITKKIQRLFFSSVFILIFGMSSVLGAGYTCPTTKNYTSCSANYYRVKNTSNSYYTCTACPSNSTSSANNTATGCTCKTGYSVGGTVGGATTGVTSACSPILTYVTLDQTGATTTGTLILYAKYGATSLYSNTARTTTISKITVPQKKYTVTYNANGGSVSTTSATSNCPFAGYGTYVNADGTITTAGINAANSHYTQEAYNWGISWGTCGSVTLPTPTRTGYTFKGWSTSSTATSGSTGSYTPTSNVTLYATWSPNTYKVTLDKQSGTGGTSEYYYQYKTLGSCYYYTTSALTTCIAGTQGVSITVPTRTGYTFGGYYTGTNGTGTQYVNASGGTVNNLYSASAANITLYAKWTANCNKITLNNTTNGGSGGTTALYKKSGSTTWYSDSSCSTAVTSITKPSKTNATYGGHYNTSAASGGTQIITAAGALSTTWTVTGATTLYAQYDCNTGYVKSGTRISGACAANTYTVTYNANGGSGTTASSSHTYGVSKALTTNGFTNGTKKFLGWSTSNSATSATYTNGQSVSNLTTANGGTVPLYAVWGTCTACSAGTGATCSLSAPLGVCTYATACKTGYNTIVNNGKYNPSCSANKYTVSFNINGGSGSTPSSVTATYDSAMPTYPALETTPYKTGYTFMGWYDNATYTSGTKYYNADGTSARTWNKTSNATLYAGWQANTITVVYNGNGQTSGSVANQTCYYDQDCIVQGQGNLLKTNYVLPYWTYNSTVYKAGANIKNIITGGTVTLTAAWKLEYTKIILGDNGGSGGSGTIYLKYDASNDTLSLTNSSKTAITSVAIPTRTGYTFAGYEINECEFETVCSFGSATENGVLVYWRPLIGADGKLVYPNETIGYNGDEGYWTARAKWTVNSYTCAPGKYLNGTTCATCDANYYCLGGTWSYNGGIQGRSACTSWRANTTTNGATGSTSTSACVCAAGYGLNGSSCTYCSAGTYKTSAENTSCLTCTSNSYCTGGTHIATCSSFNASYQYSDSGTGSSNYCYASKPKTGSQNPCSKPANSYTYTCNSCNPGKCSYRDYYNATDTTCTPTNCTQTATVNTCAASYYKNDNACLLCSGLANGLYPNSDNGNSSGTSACFTDSLSGKVIATANASTTTDCDTKYFKTAHTVNYGSTSSCMICPPTASGSDNGRDSSTDCYVSCSAKTISNGTTTVVNAKEYFTGSEYPACTYNVNCNAKYGASGNKTTNPACTICANNQYSAGGTATCSTCSNAPANTNYTGPASSSSCPWECNAGYYGSSANGDTSCAACGSGYFCTGGIHRAHCSTTLKSGAATPDSYTSLSSGSWSDYTHGTSASDCICNWYFSDESTTRYLMQSACQNGPTGHKYRTYSQCRSGYYATGSLGWGNWYTSCTACDNAPNNATYTSYSTPSEMYAEESNCPWECNDGYNLTADNQCGQFCTSGITHIKLGNGLTIPLYSSARTSPAINVKVNNAVCYGSLATGQSSGALNVKVGSTTYHAVQ